MPEHGLGRRHDPETPRAVALYPVATATTERVDRKWNQKGAWLDQGSYGTCVGNAFGHRRADGPVKVEGIDQTWAQRLYLEASALYWGEPDQSMQKGTSGLSACQVLLRRGAIDGYEWITGTDALRYALLELGPLCVGTTWYESMYSPKKVGDQRYMRVNFDSAQLGGHEYVINGIDLDPQDGSEPYYRMKNSWGKDWGNGGTARFRLAELEQLIFEGWGDAVLIHELPKEAA